MWAEVEKKLSAARTGLDEAFIEVLAEHTAGDPMRAEVRWTNLTRHQIAMRLAEKGFMVSRNIVKRLLKKHG